MLVGSRKGQPGNVPFEGVMVEGDKGSVVGRV